MRARATDAPATAKPNGQSLVPSSPALGSGRDAGRDDPRSLKDHLVVKGLAHFFAFVVVPILLFLVFLNLTALFDTLIRFGPSAGPPSLADSFTHLPGIDVSNELLLSIQTGLVLTLLGLSFFERGDSARGPVDRGGEWFKNMKRSFDLTSLDWRIQFSAFVISGEVTTVSFLNLYRRFRQGNERWETSLLAFLLIGWVYLVVCSGLFASGPAASFAGRALRLADVIGALADIALRFDGRTSPTASPLSMRRTHLGRDRHEMGAELTQILDAEDLPPRVDSSPGRSPFRGISWWRSLLTEVRIPLCIVVCPPIAIAIVLLVFDESTKPVILAKTLALAVFLLFMFLFSLLLLYVSVEERLSQRAFVVLVVEVWALFTITLLVFLKTALTRVSRAFAASPSIGLIVTGLVVLEAVGFVWWGRLLANPLRHPERAPLSRIIEHVRTKLEAERDKLIRDLRREFPGLSDSETTNAPNATPEDQPRNRNDDDGLDHLRGYPRVGDLPIHPELRSDHRPRIVRVRSARR